MYVQTLQCWLDSDWIHSSAWSDIFPCGHIPLYVLINCQDCAHMLSTPKRFALNASQATLACGPSDRIQMQARSNLGTYRWQLMHPGTIRRQKLHWKDETVTTAFPTIQCLWQSGSCFSGDTCVRWKKMKVDRQKGEKKRWKVKNGYKAMPCSKIRKLILQSWFYSIALPPFLPSCKYWLEKKKAHFFHWMEQVKRARREDEKDLCVWKAQCASCITL